MRNVKIFLYKLFRLIKSKMDKFFISIQNEYYNSKLNSKNKLRCGKNVFISGINKLEIGNNVYIGSNSFIRAEGGVKLGDNVIISRNVVIYSHSHNYEGEYLPFDNTYKYKPVIIEDNVWIGMNVTIAPGTYIGEGSIIGIGARIFGKIPSFSIVGSNGKIIKTRNIEHYKQLKKENKFADDDGNPAKEGNNG